MSQYVNIYFQNILTRLCMGKLMCGGFARLG